MTHLNGTAPATIEAARRYQAAGRSVIPDHPIKKYPFGIDGWQAQAFTLDEIEARIGMGWGIGIRMDGPAEGIDLDAKHWIGDPAEFIAAYEALVEELAPGLLARLVIERTQSGGRHYAYMCSAAVDAGNQKLAERETTNDERARNPGEQQLTLIETRGTGGQFVVAPTPGYALLQGDWAALPEITPEERQALFIAARSFHQIPEPVIPDAHVRTSATFQVSDGSVIDAYNAHADEAETLQRLLQAGWRAVAQRGGTIYLCRPGKQHGVSATFGHVAAGVLYVFSSNAAPFAPDHAYSAFGIAVELDYSGDVTAAVNAEAERLNINYYPVGEPVERESVLYCPRHTSAALRNGKKASWLFCACKRDTGGWCDYRARVHSYTAPAKSQTDAAGADTADDPRPAIDISAIDLPTLMPQAWDAIVAQNDPPTLFRRAGELARLEATESGALVVKTVDTRVMLGALARAARWVKVSYTRSARVEREALPPAAVVDDAMVNIDPRIPPIVRVVSAPTFADANTLLATPGYHAATRVYYDPKPGMSVPPIPDEPTDADLDRARNLILDDLLTDFLFVSEADQAHAVALFLLPFVRELINGPTPLHLIEAPTMGSGKGLLTDVLLLPALGSLPAPMTEATTDEEWGKTITSNLLAAPAAIVIDNLNRKLASGKLAAALTTTEFSDRILGKSEQIALPVRCVWVATANNPTLSTEISRRCIRIRIDPKIDQPWKREGFKHPKLRSWVEANRGDLIWAALIICRFGLQAGASGPALGSYEAWSDVIGRILAGAGFPGFLGNLDALYDRADVEGAAWRALIAAWWEKHQSTAQPAGELFPLVAEAEADVLISGKDELGLKKSFGKALARAQDRVFSIEIDGAMLRFQVAEGGVRHKAKLWKLAPMEEGGLGGLGGLFQPHTRNNNFSTFPAKQNPQNTHNPPGYAGRTPAGAVAAHYCR